MNVTEASFAAMNPEFAARNAPGPGNELGAAEFLKLLVTQLTFQDPLSPMEDTAFIAQMSSFTSLEQMRTLATDFAGFRQQQENVAVLGYLGKHVTLEDSSGNVVTGEVQSIVLEGDKPRIVIDGKPYDPRNVFKLETVPSNVEEAAVIDTNDQNND